jgi:hypothetical protein
MTSNLTEEQRVAWRIQGVGPDPAHTLVVFKQNGTGRALNKVLAPGEVLRVGWLDSRDSYTAYAVSNDENLRHSFSRKYQAAGQAWTFTLHFELDFRVADPRALALKLEGGDPLRSLEDEVARVLNTTARHLPWEAFLNESTDFGLRLLEAESTEGLGEKRLNFDRLRSFAASLGLLLRNVEVTRSLTEEVIQAEIKVREIARQKMIDDAAERAEQEQELVREKHRQEREALALRGSKVLNLTREEQQQELELFRERYRQEREALALEGSKVLDRTREEQQQELELSRERHRVAREAVALQGRQALDQAERLKKVLDGIANEGLRALGRSVESVSSFAGINDALVAIRGIQANLSALSAGPGPLPALGAAGIPVLPLTSDEPAPPRMRQPADPLERLVDEAFIHLRALDDNPQDRRRLRATVLHLLAEAALGSDGDGEYLEGCRESLERQLYPLESALSEEERNFFRRIADVETLRLELA